MLLSLLGCEQQGYLQDGPGDGYHAAFAGPDQAVRIELHRALGTERLHRTLSTDEIWQAARPAPFGEATGWVMSPEHLPLYLALHIIRHRFHVPLRALWDLRLCGPQPQAEDLGQQLVAQALEVFEARSPVSPEGRLALSRVLDYQAGELDLEAHLHRPAWRAARDLLLGLDPSQPDLTLSGLQRRLGGAARFLFHRMTTPSLRQAQSAGYALERELGLRRPRPSLGIRLEAWLGLVLAVPALQLFGALALLRRLGLRVWMRWNSSRRSAGVMSRSR